MELIVVTLLCIVIIVALLKGVNITIKHEYPVSTSIADTLYDDNGEATEDPEDYLQSFLNEVHDLMQEDTLDG